MSGFFSREEVTAPKRKKKSIAKKRGGCESCKAYATCNHGKFPIAGTGKNGILIVDGSVSSQEEASGIPFSGITQKYLRSRLALFGVDLEDCYYVHAIRCYIKANPKKPNKPPVPTTAMKNGCRFLLEEDIKRLKPKKIIALGDLAVEAIYGERATRSRIGGGNAERYYGHSIPDQDLETWVFPNYSPQFPLEAIGNRQRMLKKFNRYKAEHCALWDHSILKNDDNFRIRDLYFKQYLGKALTHKKEFVKTDYLKNNCVWIQTASEATAIMQSLLSEDILALDYETNCLKPYADTSKLITVSFSTRDVSYGFDYYGNNETFKQAMRAILESNKIKKILANTGMEYAWSYIFLGCHINNVFWDTIVASHFLNPTVKRGNSLKFCGFKYEGILGYDSDIDEFLKGDTNADKPQYAVNAIEKVHPEKRSLYCAMDSFLTMKVFEKQYVEISNDKRMYPLFKDYVAGTVLFSKTSIRGFTVKEDVLIKNMEKAERKLIVLQSKIENTEEVKIWNEENVGRKFKVTSNDDLRELFFDILGFDTQRRTKSGQKSVDADVMAALSDDSELAVIIGEHNTQVKILEVLEGIRKNTVNGKIHPEILLFVASTGRSSSVNINFQNIPLHNPIYSKEIRSCLSAPDGKEIVDFDFSALEKRLAYSVHKDPVFLAELEGADSHAATAEYIFLDNEKATKRIAELLYPEKSTFTEDELEKVFEKEVRKHAKGPGFALQYGCAPPKLHAMLWDEALRPHHKQYFAEIGIKTSEQFKKHSGKVFSDYWERFKVQNQWRDDAWEDYLSKGYAYSVAGWKMSGIASKNLLCNALVQGVGFAVTLAAALQLEKDLEGYASEYVLSVHDAAYIFVDPEEYFNGGVKEIITNSMTTYINNKYDWMIFPMDAGPEYTLGDWHTEATEKEFKEKYEIK